MLRFILAIMIIAVLLKVSQRNAYVGFGIWLLMSVSFMIYTNYVVDCDDVEIKKNMLKDQQRLEREGRLPLERRRSFLMLNTR